MVSFSFSAIDAARVVLEFVCKKYNEDPTFETFHEPRKHWAVINGELIGPFSTEVDLVRMLAPKIDLRKFAYSADGNENHCRIVWWMK